jgi:hypothetical protein
MVSSDPTQISSLDFLLTVDRVFPMRHDLGFGLGRADDEGKDRTE